MMMRLLGHWGTRSRGLRHLVQGNGKKGTNQRVIYFFALSVKGVTLPTQASFVVLPFEWHIIPLAVHYPN